MNNKALGIKIEKYSELALKIEGLKKEISGIEERVLNQFLGKYQKLKTDIKNYFVKIKPTVDIVISLSKGDIVNKNGTMHCNGQAIRPLNFNPEVVDVYSKQTANKLFSVITSITYQPNRKNLYKDFCVLYNTLNSIYDSLDDIGELAAYSASENERNELMKLERQRDLLMSKSDFDKALTKIKTESEYFYNLAMIKDKINLETEYKTEVSLPCGVEEIDGLTLITPTSQRIFTNVKCWDLHSDGVFLVKADGKSLEKKELDYFSINTILNFIHSYPGNSKKILLCDSIFSANIASFVGEIKSGNTELFFNNANNSFIKNNEESIRDSIDELNKIINERLLLLGQSRYSSILEYNSSNTDNTQPLILVFINGYPLNCEVLSKELSSALKNGNKAGVFFLITENKDAKKSNSYYRDEDISIADFTKNVYEYNNGYLDSNDAHISINLCADNYDLHAICESYLEEVKKNSSPIIYLDSVCQEDEFVNSSRRKDFSMTLSVPIGKQGAKPINIDLSAKDAPHLALIGTTGSGKTAFINSFVLSACRLYSPEELELHLIVMVKGDFKVFEEEKLPHLKTVVTGDRIFAANDVLDFIDEEMKRRGEIIGSLGNIYAYNEVAEKKLPRCVIIIDEFYQLVQGSDEAIDRVNRIAQVGRAYGISLVISSIRFPMEVNSLIPLFEHKIEFKSKENAGQLIPEVARRQGELESANGLCFYSCKGNLYSVRVAYSEEGEALKNHLIKIRNKFSDYHMELQSEIKAYEVDKNNMVPYLSKRAKYDYDEEGIIRTRLGKSYLSNKRLEFSFDSKYNSLFLFGHYLETKEIEAGLIKETLNLSKHIDEPTVYYLDLNRNASLKRAKTIIKELRDSWVLDGRVVYGANDDKDDIFDEIKDLIKLREEDDESSIHPVLVVISKAESAFEDDDDCEALIELIQKGKDSNIYFVFQCNETISFYNSDKYINNAIIFPDRYMEGEAYSSDSLIKALENMPAGSTSKGKKIISNALVTPLHPQLHILCIGTQISIFIPYKYKKEYFN